MKIKINIDDVHKQLRFNAGDEYVLYSLTNKLIHVSTSSTQLNLYSYSSNNGTSEVFVFPRFEELNTSIYIFISEKETPVEVKIVNTEFFLSDHYEDISPAFIEDEYPLFKIILDYWFKYVGLEGQASHFINNFETLNDLDSTLPDFKEFIYDEHLKYFAENISVNKDILTKYILQFYQNRGTEESIRFLMRVLFNKEINIFRGRDNVLILSDLKQGKLSDREIFLQDNYNHQLHSYIIDIEDEDFIQYKDIFTKLVNPTGYLPFGNKNDKIEDTYTNGNIVVNAI